MRIRVLVNALWDESNFVAMGKSTDMDLDDDDVELQQHCNEIFILENPTISMLDYLLIASDVFLIKRAVKLLAEHTQKHRPTKVDSVER